MNPLPQPSEAALRAYKRWRTDNGHGAVPDDGERDMLLWTAGFDYEAPEPPESPSWARCTP